MKIKNLSKSFGGKTVLNQVNLEVAEGEIIFVIGKSGTGKSVLLKTIVGLLRADAGEIWVDGVNVAQLPETELFHLRKKCGMVFQSPALFDSLDVFENVAFGMRRHFKDISEKEISDRVTKFLNLVNLHGVEKRSPQDISYGMQKRVSFARTVAIEPKYLLIDEPTTGLDPVTTNSINALIKELSRSLKTTSIVISHDMEGAFSMADRIAVLDGGCIIELGTPSAIKLSKNKLVRDFLAELAPVMVGPS